MNVRTSLSATPALPASPGPPDAGDTPGVCDLEDQFSRVLARQSVQDDELTTLHADVTGLTATLRALNIPTPNTSSSPPVPALQAKLEREHAARERAERTLSLPSPSGSTTPSPDVNKGVYRLEARIDRQDSQIRALTLAVETLTNKVLEQNTQLAQIVASRPDAQIAALRTELSDMRRWCERFNSAHDRTLARCTALELKLNAANAEVARLRDAAKQEAAARRDAATKEAATREAAAREAAIKRAKAHANGQREVLEDVKEEEEGKENATTAKRQIDVVRNNHGNGGGHGRRRSLKTFPSLPELPPNSPFAVPM